MKPSPSAETCPQALAALHEPAYRWALICCAFDEDMARETMQTAYLEIMTGRAAFGGRASPKTWLFAVVRNTARRLATAARRRRDGAERLARLDQSEHAPDVGLDATANGEDRRAVLAALDPLPTRQRQVIELVYYHELSIAEAAAVLGIGTGAARQHFHRAKRALAAALAPLREADHDR